MATPSESSMGRRSTLRERIRQPFISGLAIAVPVLVTLVVFRIAMGFLLDSVGPLAQGIQSIPGVPIGNDLAADLAALLVLTLFIFVVGLVAESRWASGRLEQGLDSAMSSIPGLGSVYSSFNEMSDMLLDSSTQSFQEVKLVEYPVEGSYCVAFVTADTPSNICEATDNDGMTTLYMPMAPNPVMGGFVLHIADEKVYDVDMTVEQGVQSIVTSGIAVGETDDTTIQHVDGATGTTHLPDESSDGPS